MEQKDKIEVPIRTVTRYHARDFIHSPNEVVMMASEVDPLLTALEFQQGRADKWVTVAEQRGAELSDVKAALAEQEKEIVRLKDERDQWKITAECSTHSNYAVGELTERAETAEAKLGALQIKFDKEMDQQAVAYDNLNDKLQAAEEELEEIRQRG